MHQIYPVVRRYYEDAADQQQFSRVVPLFCAAFTQDEAEYPPYNFLKSGKGLLVRGVSLFGVDNSNEATINPWDEITESDEEGEFRADLDVFHRTYDPVSESPFGVLHTKNLYEALGNYGDDYCAPWFEQKKLLDESSGKTKKSRDQYWRYKLPQGLDLSAFGMFVVFDSATKNHFTLAPAVRPVPLSVPRWSPPKPNIMELKPDINAPPAPECIKIMSGGKVLLAFPVMAQQFQLHDFLMKAASLPFDIGSGGGDGGSDDEKKQLGVASNVVFEHSSDLPNTYDVSCALDDLCTSGFDLEKLSTFSLYFLHTTMGELLSANEGTIDDDEEGVLGESMEIIDKQSRSNTACTPEN